MGQDQVFDIIVAGGGHAGIEAAWAASNLGAETALVTMDRQAIGRMSCNPAIGGVGKGQMVCEIDALGGLMGIAADQAGIQFRMLNRSKGPAVWAPRAQSDRNLYPAIVLSLLEQAPSLTIIEGLVEHLDTQAPRQNGQHRSIASVGLQDGRSLRSKAVILTTGTFMRGLMHCGKEQTEGGRVGEQNAAGLSSTLAKLGFELGRLKTGTPPRIHRDSIDYDACENQPGDEVPTPFSAMTDVLPLPQIACWITWTNRNAHDLILANLHSAPMYTGQIEASGPRYCPSIEDKVVRFADKPRHQIFLEPEGIDSERVYCNGISTSLPKDIQEAMVRKVHGLENARILQYGYAVEYDFLPTYQTKMSLETKLIRGLFLAGQINGTSGYEEAAAQGLVAGVNAVKFLRNDAPFVLGRDQAYIGVMIDDLITRPPAEPYRMFTSRAEYRLRLRADNADQRLTPIGRELGLVDDDRWQRFRIRRDAIAELDDICQREAFNGLPLHTWTKRPDADITGLAEALGRTGSRVFCVDALHSTLITAQYSGYVRRHDEQIERFRRLESHAIPQSVDYFAMPDLRLEAREKLARIAPQTLGQAARISGINPVDITTLWIYLSGRRTLPTKR